MAETTSSAEVLERVLQPDPTVVWRIGLMMCALLTGLGLFIPTAASGFGLALIVGLSALALQENLTARLTCIGVFANVLIGIHTVMQRGADPDLILTYLGLSLLILLTGVAGCLSVRRVAALAAAKGLSEAPARTQEPLAGQAGMNSLTSQQVLERAAEVLAQLSGAVQFTVQRVDSVNELIRGLDTARPAERHRGLRTRGWGAGGSHRFQRVLSHGHTSPSAEPVVWTKGKSEVLVKLRHPGQSEALVALKRPSAPLGFIEDAVRVLQMQIERAALLQEVHQQRELLRDLVYAFSHDLRTPITASILNAQAALHGAFGPLPDEFQESLRSSLEAHQGLLAISDQLMLLAEYESGGPAGDESAVVDLEPVLRSVLSDLSPRASTRALHFELTLDGLSTRGHRYDLRRAFQNLLDNAVKFSPPESIICVRLRREGPLAVVEVRDQGSGVALEQESRLFQRFRQTTAGSGTGIGLYLTRRIVERHGGTLTYAREAATENQPAQTVFSIHLPYVERALG